MTSNLKIELIPIEKQHIEATFEWISDPELQKLFLMRAPPPSYEHHLAYWKTVLEDENQRRFAIMLNDLHIGNCGFTILSQNECSLWIYFGKRDFRGKGHGKVALRKLLDIAFNEYGINVCYVIVARKNDQAMRLYKSLGFFQIEMDSEDRKNWNGKEVVKLALKDD